MCIGSFSPFGSLRDPHSNVFWGIPVLKCDLQNLMQNIYFNFHWFEVVVIMLDTPYVCVFLGSGISLFLK